MTGWPRAENTLRDSAYLGVGTRHCCPEYPTRKVSIVAFRRSRRADSCSQGVDPPQQTRGRSSKFSTRDSYSCGLLLRGLGPPADGSREAGHGGMGRRGGVMGVMTSEWLSEWLTGSVRVRWHAPDPGPNDPPLSLNPERAADAPARNRRAEKACAVRTVSS